MADGDELEPVWHPSKDELAEIIGLPHPQPEVRLVNQAVGVADELGRLVAAAVLVLIVMTALAIALSPWFWIGVAICLANLIGIYVWLRRRRSTPQQRAIGRR